MTVIVPETGLSPSGQPVVTLTDLENALTALIVGLIPSTGGTLTGPLLLAGDPTTSTQASTKNYVDTQVAAIDGQIVALRGLTFTATIASLRASTTTTLSGSVCFVLGFSANGDGGEGVFVFVPSDTTSADNGGTMITDASGRRWYRAGAKATYSVKWFGAVGNGTADDTAAIQQCINALYAATYESVVYLPPGSYAYAGSLTLGSGCSLQGSGVQSTFLVCTSTSGVITVPGPSLIADLAFTSPAARTAGPTISLQGNDIQIRNVVASNYFQFAKVGTTGSTQAVGVRFIDSDFFQPAVGAGSGAIDFQNYSNAVVKGCIISGAGGSGQQADYGIRLDNGDTAIFSDNNISAHGYAIIFETASGQNAYATQVSNCLLDSSGLISGSSHASGLGMAQAGNVQDAQFCNCWFGLSSGGSGALLSPSGGTVKDVDFTGCKFIGNAIDGITLSGAGVSSICISGGDAKANANAGIDIENGATDITVTGVRAASNSRGNQNVGINFTGAASNCLITGNNCHGNVDAGLVSSSTGSNNTVTNNLTA